MNVSTSTSAGTFDAWWPLRVLLRVPLLILHAVVSLPVTLWVVARGYDQSGAAR